jgi:hypothetical protein
VAGPFDRTSFVGNIGDSGYLEHSGCRAAGAVSAEWFLGEPVMAWHRDGGHGGHAHEVAAGQQYVQINAYRNVWEVKDVFNLSDDIAHARLARVDEPSVTKTVSCISLAEGSFFELVEDRRSGDDAAAIDDFGQRADETGPGGVNVQWRENLDSLPHRKKSQLLRRLLRS